ncbi:MAG: DUF2207 domain-containing protein [Pseudomonadota bacterium]
METRRFALDEMFPALRPFAVLAGILFFCLTSSAYATEGISSSTINLELRADGKVDVTEELLVRAEGDQIKRGIFRDFILADDSISRPLTIEIKAVTRDGSAEASKLTKNRGSARLYIGNSNRLLQPGVYRYTIQYVIDGALRETESETLVINWNLTGNDWAFPIDQVRATVSWPPGGTPERYKFYSGARGRKQSDATLTSIPTGVIAELAKPLFPGEGLTLAAEFDPAVFTERPTSLLERLIAYHKNLVFGAMGALAIFVGLFVAWMKNGRDLPGPVVPQYEPPHALGPMAVEFIYNMGASSRILTTGILSLATKRYLTIESEDREEFTLMRTWKDVSLSKAERALADALYKGKPARFVVSKKNRKVLMAARSAVLSALRQEFLDNFFRTNRKTLIFAAVASIAVFVVTASTLANLLPMVMASVVGGLLAYTISPPIFKALGALTGQSRLPSLLPVIIPALVIFLYFGVPVLVLINQARSSGSDVLASPQLDFVFAGMLGMMLGCFLYLMKAPTPVGRKVRDQILGFQQYLRLTKRPELDEQISGASDPGSYTGVRGKLPELTPKHFEACLPYAVGLGVGDEWAEQFEGVISRMANSKDQLHYRPTWVSYDAIGGARKPGNLVDFLDTGLQPAVSSAMQSRSSGSSFGGGGSGGGVGGGGGGGW